MKQSSSFLERSEFARPALQIMPLHRFSPPTSDRIAPRRAKRDEVRLLICAQRLAAIIVPQPLPREKLNLLYALAPESWSCHVGLANAWRVNAVICDRDCAGWLKGLPAAPANLQPILL